MRSAAGLGVYSPALLLVQRCASGGMAAIRCFRAAVHGHANGAARGSFAAVAHSVIPVRQSAHPVYRTRAHLLPLDKLAAGGDAVRVAEVVVRHLALRLYGASMGGSQ